MGAAAKAELQVEAAARPAESKALAAATAGLAEEEAGLEARAADRSENSSQKGTAALYPGDGGPAADPASGRRLC